MEEKLKKYITQYVQNRLCRYIKFLKAEKLCIHIDYIYIYKNKRLVIQQSQCPVGQSSLPANTRTSRTK